MRVAIAAANLAARLTPNHFRHTAGTRFVTPRPGFTAARGRDFLHTLTPRDFAGPLGRQRAWTGGDGPQVFLQHGWETDSADMADHAAALIDAGFSVVLIDGPAHGASEGKRATLLDFAAGLGTAAQVFGPPDAMVAHSMGAPSAVIAMRDGRIAPEVFVALGAPRSLRENTRHQARGLGLRPRAVELLIEGVQDRFDIALNTLDMARDAPAMTARALFVHGEDDDVCPPQGARDTAAVWPGAELDICPGLGHRGVLRDEGAVARTARFLQCCV